MHNEGNCKKNWKDRFQNGKKTIANEATDKESVSKIYNGVNTISLTNGAGKSGQPTVKEGLSNTIHKSKLKMD